MYDPSNGRWLTEDPIGFKGGDANLYRYVHNNPLGATDPSGLWADYGPNYAEQERQAFQMRDERDSRPVAPQVVNAVPPVATEARGFWGGVFSVVERYANPLNALSSTRERSAVTNWFVSTTPGLGMALDSLDSIADDIVGFQRNGYNTPAAVGMALFDASPASTTSLFELVVGQSLHGRDLGRQFDAFDYGVGITNKAYEVAGFLFGNSLRPEPTPVPQGPVQVTTWTPRGTPVDFTPTRWIMEGGPSGWNYFRTGLWGPQAEITSTFPYIRLWVGGDYVPTSTLVPPWTVQWPSGLDVWKGLFGQRQIGPP